MPFDISKIYTDFVSWVIVTVVGGCAAWIVALRRKVNTNEKLIEAHQKQADAQFSLIMQRLDMRDQSREEDRENVERLGTDVRELRTDIREIKNALISKG